MYADDLFVICSDENQLKATIQVVKDWSVCNSMILNKTKSGVMEFKSRRQKTSANFQNTQSTFEEIPVVSQYRYLGLNLTPSLHLNAQIKYISIKAKEIFTRLYPFIKTAEADTRKNLWQVFILPLFEFLLPLYANECTKFWKNKITKLVNGTFKLFIGLSKSTPDYITQLLLGYNFIQRAYFMQMSNQMKWEERSKKIPSQEPLRRFFKPKKGSNMLSKTLNELVQYINLCNGFCYKCQCKNSITHLRLSHNFSGPNIPELLLLTQDIRLQKQIRKTTLDKVRSLLSPLVIFLRTLLKT